MEKDMEQPKMGTAKLLRSKVFWVGDYNYTELCMVRSIPSHSSDLRGGSHHIGSLMHICRPQLRDRDLTMLAHGFSIILLQCQATHRRIAFAMAGA
jgi:hypothetical protein